MKCESCTRSSISPHDFALLIFLVIANAIVAELIFFDSMQDNKQNIKYEIVYLLK